jgi:hypothetical protein
VAGVRHDDAGREPRVVRVGDEAVTQIVDHEPLAGVSAQPMTRARL